MVLQAARSQPDTAEPCRACSSTLCRLQVLHRGMQRSACEEMLSDALQAVLSRLSGLWQGTCHQQAALTSSSTTMNLEWM